MGAGFRRSRAQFDRQNTRNSLYFSLLAGKLPQRTVRFRLPPPPEFLRFAFFSSRDTMFDFVTKHKRLLQFVLALMIVPPFAFWGIQWTQRETAGAGEVASVGGQKITDQKFGEALRQQQERLRGMLGRNFDPGIFDSPAIRLELLEGMISQRLMMQHAARNHLTVSDETLVDTTMSIPAFQVDGKFSRERYDATLRKEGMSADAF